MVSSKESVVSNAFNEDAIPSIVMTVVSSDDHGLLDVDYLNVSVFFSDEDSGLI